MIKFIGRFVKIVFILFVIYASYITGRIQSRHEVYDDLIFKNTNHINHYMKLYEQGKGAERVYINGKGHMEFTSDKSEWK